MLERLVDLGCQEVKLDWFWEAFGSEEAFTDERRNVFKTQDDFHCWFSCISICWHETGNVIGDKLAN